MFHVNCGVAEPLAGAGAISLHYVALEPPAGRAYWRHNANLGQHNVDLPQRVSQI